MGWLWNLDKGALKKGRHTWILVTWALRGLCVCAEDKFRVVGLVIKTSMQRMTRQGPRQGDVGGRGQSASGI